MLTSVGRQLFRGTVLGIAGCAAASLGLVAGHDLHPLPPDVTALSSGPGGQHQPQSKATVLTSLSLFQAWDPPLPWPRL